MRKTYESAGYSRRLKTFAFEAAKPGTKVDRRADPVVSCFTRMRDDILERRAAERKPVKPAKRGPWDLE